MKIIGYGICGPGEAGRYMLETVKCLKRLCDEVIILVNGRDGDDLGPEMRLLETRGIRYAEDRREWGKFQWKIKQDFIEGAVADIAEVGDMMVCLDMDEVLDGKLTREWLLEAPCDAYKVFIVDLWNDTEHYKPESCFWNTRLWRWNGETAWEQKPLHCGLSPLWTRSYNRYAPFFLWHKGLMKKEDRERKLKRYMKYDPEARHLAPLYYDMLRSDRAMPLDLAILERDMAKAAPTFNEKKPNMLTKPRKQRFAYVKNPHGQVVDIPERHVEQTMARKGFEWIGWVEDEDKEMEELFADTEIEGTDVPEVLLDPSAGAYQRPMRDEKRDLYTL